MSRHPLRFLLRMLPWEFRQRYGDDIEQVFREQRKAAQEPAQVAGVWVRTMRDLFATSLSEHAARLRQDLRYALRDMRKHPGFVAAAVLTLAVGIGMNAAMFSVLYAVMLRPLPYRDSGKLVAIWNRWQGQDKGGYSDPEYLDLSEKLRTMDVAAVAEGSAAIADDNGNAEREPAAYISTNAFDVLGVAPILGRGFTKEEESPGRDAVAIVSEALWRDRWRSSPAILGKTVLVDGRPSVIVGVLGADSRLPMEFGAGERVGVIMPLAFERSASRSKRGGHYLRVAGRIRDGVSLSAARADLQSFLKNMKNSYPSEYDMPLFDGYLRPLRSDLLGDSSRTLFILSLAVGMVLLLACANVANLMLARGEARRGELSIRMALGASRMRIVRQLVTEGLVLSCVGAAVGLGLAAASQRALQYWASNGAVSLPRLSDVSINLPLVIFIVALALITPLLFGLFPALPISQDANGHGLYEGSRSANQRLRPHVRRLLVASQMMLATVLLIATGLLLKSMIRVLEQPSGIVTDHVLTFRISLPEAQYQDVRTISGFFTRLNERIAALPGVKSVGANSGLPMAYASGDWSFDIEGRPAVMGKHAGKADWYVVTPGYFETLGIGLERGRLPQSSDTPDSAPVIFLNETTAKALFPNENPIGYKMKLTASTGAPQPWRTIAGVVKNVRHFGLEAAPHAEMYIPSTQFLHFKLNGQARNMTIAVRTAVDPLALMPSIRTELARLDPLVPASDVRAMQTVVDESTADRRMTVSMVSVFGLIAVVLAIIGVYGVMDYTVTQRTREIGVRLAIGAPRAAVQGLILRDGLRVIIMGVAAGAVLSAVFGSVLASLLYEVRPRDVVVYLLAVAVVAAIGIVATYLPARRGAHMDPMAALRTE